MSGLKIYSRNVKWAGQLTRWIWSKERGWPSVHTWGEFEFCVWLRGTLAAKLLVTEHFSSISVGSVSDQFQIKDRFLISPKLNWDIDSCQESWNSFHLTLKQSCKTRTQGVLQTHFHKMTVREEPLRRSSSRRVIWWCVPKCIFKSGWFFTIVLNDRCANR